MKKLILFGDSITAGYFDGFISTMLTSGLKAQLPHMEIINVGIPGDTTDGALTRVQKHVINRHPDYVTIFFGSNDAALDSQVPIERYEENLQQIIQQIGAEKVFLITPALANQAVQEANRPTETLLKYGQVVRNLAATYQTQLIDLQQTMYDLSDYTDLLQPDGFHFSKAGYAFLVEQIVQELKRAN
ncbi:GDSL-type esterase/lipase family protein [Isobaculum melis]|uniref:Lysophospholipase L1 n=1 Tax=Isobaculum melis TaxID=142588 RepID=A0A1H9PRC7_9LACT|nr:GDSL-type esterase/lipase family protein [Isobaculum melis]SER50123.1 Lysophospholipase L1 [Isobaculum melis]